MEEGDEMSMGEDQAAPLVTEALPRICLASHIRCVADLLHADAIQQLEVALLGTLVAQVIELLSGGLSMASTSMSTSVTPVQPHPRSYTSTPPALPPSSVSVLGISTTSPTPAAVPAMASSSVSSVSLLSVVESALLETLFVCF